MARWYVARNKNIKGIFFNTLDTPPAIDSFRIDKTTDQTTGMNCVVFKLDRMNLCQMVYTVATFYQNMTLLRTFETKSLEKAICDDQHLFDNVMYANVNATWRGLTGPQLDKPKLVGSG